MLRFHDIFPLAVAGSNDANLLAKKKVLWKSLKSRLISTGSPRSLFCDCAESDCKPMQAVSSKAGNKCFFMGCFILLLLIFNYRQINIYNRVIIIPSKTIIIKLVVQYTSVIIYLQSFFGYYPLINVVNS